MPVSVSRVGTKEFDERFCVMSYTKISAAQMAGQLLVGGTQLITML